MSGKGPITEAVGATRTLSNGAIAKVVQGMKKDGTAYKRLQIIQGADAGHIGKNINHKRRSVSPEAAKKAFTRYWNARYNAAKKVSNRKAGAVKAAWTRDERFTREKYVRDNTSYLRNPGKFEYRGVDTGPKTYKKASGKRAEALARGHAALAAADRHATARKAAATRYSRLSPARQARADKRKAKRSGGQAGGYFF